MRFIQRKYETVSIREGMEAIPAQEYFGKVTLPEALQKHVVYVIEGKAYIVKPATE